MRDRVTVREDIYYQLADHQPHHFPDGFNYHPKNTEEEQPWERVIKVGEQWQPVDFGWLTALGASLISIRNEEGEFGQVHPSPEQQAESDKKVVELAYRDSTDGWFIPPQQSIRGCPSNLTQLCIRCRHGSAKVRVIAFPV